MVVTEVLVMVVVSPPEIVLVRIVVVREVIGAMTPRESPGGCPLSTVVETLVGVVVASLGIGLVG